MVNFRTKCNFWSKYVISLVLWGIRFNTGYNYVQHNLMHIISVENYGNRYQKTRMKQRGVSEEEYCCTQCLRGHAVSESCR